VGKGLEEVVPVLRLLSVMGGMLLLMTIASPISAQPRDTVIVGLVGEPDHIVPGFSRLAVTGYVTSTRSELTLSWR
jgi:hypothetical protein